MKRCLLIAAAALAVLMPASAHAQYFGQNKVQYQHRQWKSISSDHFEVTFYTGEDSLAMRVLDLAEKTNVVLSKRMGHRLGRRVPIILYGSHNAFAQTNVTPELIDSGTGGFTELLRNRVVLPFTGSYEDLRHVVVHELTHAFMFDMLYEGSAAALIARQSFYAIPLWFAEGMAEYFSLGMEPNAETFLRDGTVEGYLPPLEYAGGFIVYKQGQSAISYLCTRFGEERLRDVLKRVRQMRNFERAFERSTGYSVGRFDEQWRGWLRRQYWPSVATKQAPEEFARRLTDHRRDQSNLNTAPTVSPQGDRVAYFSDRRQYTDVYIMSALDGKVLRRVIRGERNVHFESVPSFRSTMAWSPDGTRLALTAKTGGKDMLYVVDADDGKILRRAELPCEAMADPAWSPVSDSIVVAGVLDGRSDLWMIDIKTRKNTRLTNDTFDEREPAWSPDGRTLAFSSDRTAPVVLLPGRHEQGHGRYGIYSMNMATHAVEPLLDTAGEDRKPAWSPDGKLVAFISDYAGGPDIFVFSREDSTVTQLTDVLGGVESLSWSRQNDRMVFAAFNRAGYDVFAVREPVSVPGVLARLRRQTPRAALTLAGMRIPRVDSTVVEPQHGALAIGWADSVAIRDGVPGASGGPAPAPASAPATAMLPIPMVTPPPAAPVAAVDSAHTATADSAHTATADSSAVGDSTMAAAPSDSAAASQPTAAATDSTGAPIVVAPVPIATTNPTSTAPVAGTPTPSAADRDTLRLDDGPGASPWAQGPKPYPALPDTATPLATTIPLVENGGPFALPDSVLGQTPTPYKPRLAPDYGGAGFYAATGYGFVGSTQFVFSDFLGDHSLYLATDVLSSSLEETNAIAIYSYLPRRWDFGFGVFHFKDYYDSQVSTLGESFGSPRLFSERNFGALVSASYPFDRFRRIEFNFTQMFLERQFFEENVFGDLVQAGRDYRSVSSPSVSIVGDNTLFGYYGPVNGQRYNLTYTPSFAWFDNALAYHTVTFDWRRYWDFTRGYTFAGRTLLGVSEGSNPQAFRVGGFSTLRGFPDFDLLGTRVAIEQAELRFPFIHQLGVVGPLPIGMFNLRGALFSDIGAVWTEDRELRLSHRGVDGKRRLLDPRSGAGVGVGFGTGLRTSMMFFILKLDVAWRYDLDRVSRPRYYFSIGPEF